MESVFAERTAPMVDIHRHLDGNIRLSTIIDLAQANGVELPSYQVSGLAEHVYISDKTSDLLAFLQKLDMGVSVLSTLDACKRIAFENVEDAVNEGLHHVELRFSPYYMAMAFKLPLAEVVAAVVAGVEEANQTFNYHATLIGILSRTFGTDACMHELEALLQHKDKLKAVDLAGDELGFPAKLFVPHFNKVKDAGLNITIHAGEAAGPESIWDAIRLLHADRIGHAVAAHADLALMDYMATHQIGIESCLLSNYQTGTWLNMATHPVTIFLKHHIPVSINTDDPGVSNNTLKSEYQLAKNVVGLSMPQILTLQNNALQQAFLSAKEKDAILASL